MTAKSLTQEKKEYFYPIGRRIAVSVITGNTTIESSNGECFACINFALILKSKVCLNAGSFLHVWGRICLTIMIIRYAINPTFRCWYGMPRHKILWRRLALGELNSTPQVKATGLYLTVPSPRNDIVFCDVRHELWNCVREIYIQVEFRKFLQNICTMKRSMGRLVRVIVYWSTAG